MQWAGPRAGAEPTLTLGQPSIAYSPWDFCTTKIYLTKYRQKCPQLSVLLTSSWKMFVTNQHMDKWNARKVETERNSSPAAAKLLQSCPTLCDPIDGSPLGSSVPGILQTRTLEWVAISFSNAWKWKVKLKSLSHAHLLATPWTVVYQASPSMGFSRQEYWSGLPLRPKGN